MCAAVLAIAGAADVAVDAQTPSRQLVVFGNDDYAPLSYLENGVPKGLEIDLVRAVSREMGRELRLELMDWSVARERVLRGDADALIDLARDNFGSQPFMQWEYLLATASVA